MAKVLFFLLLATTLLADALELPLRSIESVRGLSHEEAAKRLKREALESHRDAYLGRKKAVRDSIRAGVVTAVSLMLFLAFLSATCDAMKYEWQTKPAMLKTNGVK
mgnify:CR=1 FL=1